MLAEPGTMKKKEEECETFKRYFLDLLEDPEVREALIAALAKEQPSGRPQERRRLFI